MTFFSFRFSSVIEICKMCPRWKELKVTLMKKPCDIFFLPCFEWQWFLFVTPVSFYHIYSSPVYFSFKDKSSKNEGTNVSSWNSWSMASVIYRQWLHLWHEALFMILLYKWLCLKYKKMIKYKMYNNGPEKETKLCCISMK